MHPVVRSWALGAALLTAACSEWGNGAGQISQRIGEITSHPEAREVDLAALTSFGWDRFYIFQPGTPREEICRFVGANRTNCGRVFRYEAVPQDSMALLFGLGSQLTHTELHALANGRFDLPPSEHGHPKSAAVFRIRRSLSGASQEIWLAPK